MKLLIIGASQGTGALLTGLALDRGHQVTAFSRQPARLGRTHERLRLFPGNMHDATALHAAMAGHDAVVITASSLTFKGFREQPDYFSRGTTLVIDAMRQHGVPRLIVLSACGVGDSLPLMNLAGRLFIRFVLPIPFADHARQEAMTRASGLNWSIARPMRLTNGPARGLFVREPLLKTVPSAISRADVAAFLLEAVETDQWLSKTVHLGG